MGRARLYLKEQNQVTSQSLRENTARQAPNTQDNTRYNGTPGKSKRKTLRARASRNGTLPLI